MTSPCTLCQYCQKTLGGGAVVAQRNEEKLLPLHAKCLALYLQAQSSKNAVDRDLRPLSLKEKIIQTLYRKKSQLLVTIFAVFVGTILLMRTYDSIFSNVPYFDSTIGRNCVLMLACQVGAMLIYSEYRDLYPELE